MMIGNKEAQIAYLGVVEQFLLAQNAKSMNPNGSCRYRFEGLKCAVGCLIPDDEIFPQIDQFDLKEIAMRCPTFGPIYDQVGRDFLLRIQMIHDSTPIQQWRESFDQLRKEIESDDE